MRPREVRRRRRLFLIGWLVFDVVPNLLLKTLCDDVYAGSQATDIWFLVLLCHTRVCVCVYACTRALICVMLNMVLRLFLPRHRLNTPPLLYVRPSARVINHTSALWEIPRLLTHWPQTHSGHPRKEKATPSQHYCGYSQSTDSASFAFKITQVFSASD